MKNIIVSIILILILLSSCKQKDSDSIIGSSNNGLSSQYVNLYGDWRLFKLVGGFKGSNIPSDTIQFSFSKENIYKIFINNSLVTENQYEIVSNSDSTYYKENWIIVFNGRPDLITINNSDSIINYYKAAFYILNDTLILNKNNILYHYFIKEE
jgi:hypothetical protein